MHVQVEVPADADRVATIARELFARRFRWWRIIGAASALVGGAYLAVALLAKSRPTLLPALVLLGLAVIYFALPILTVRASRKRSSRLATGPWSYLLSDAGLSARSPSSSQELAWDVFERAKETDTQFLLYLSKMQVVGIPHDRIAPAEREEVRSFLRSRALLPAGVGRS